MRVCFENTMINTEEIVVTALNFETWGGKKMNNGKAHSYENEWEGKDRWQW